MDAFRFIHQAALWCVGEQLPDVQRGGVTNICDKTVSETAISNKKV